MKARPSIEIRSAGKKGLGVFAARKIQKGELIESAPYLLLNPKEYDLAVKTVLIRHIYSVTAATSAVGLGFASLYNHSDDSNATYTVSKARRRIQFRALRDIRKGEEITIDYGYHPADPETWGPDWAEQYRATLPRRRKNRSTSKKAARKKAAG